MKLGGVLRTNEGNENGVMRSRTKLRYEHQCIAVQPSSGRREFQIQHTLITSRKGERGSILNTEYGSDPQRAARNNSSEGAGVADRQCKRRVGRAEEMPIIECGGNG